MPRSLAVASKVLSQERACVVTSYLQNPRAMHRSLHPLIALLLIPCATTAQDQVPAWISVTGSTGDERSTAVTLHEGHVYTTGSFSNTVDFDPGPDVVALTAAGSND